MEICHFLVSIVSDNEKWLLLFKNVQEGFPVPGGETGEVLLAQGKKRDALSNKSKIYPPHVFFSKRTAVSYSLLYNLRWLYSVVK